MKRIYLLTVIFLLLICTSGCSKSNQKDIDEIYIYHSALGQIFSEYKIDFTDESCWKYTTGIYGRYVRRDKSLENEGFTFVSDLDAEKIEQFLKDAARCGLTRWESSYINEGVFDGHQWGMIITYADATQSSVSGSNKYPETWDKMLKAFENLTGENVLIYDSTSLRA